MAAQGQVTNKLNAQVSGQKGAALVRTIAMRLRYRDRLYVTFQHRWKNPGFHVALQLVPKAEHKGKNCDSNVYDATDAGWEDVPYATWGYRRRQIHAHELHGIVSRVLVAKLPPGCADFLDSQFALVNVVQGDRSWTCRSWLNQALSVLRSLGGNFATVPSPETFEETTPFAEHAKEQLLKGNFPEDASEIPMLDKRVLS